MKAALPKSVQDARYPITSPVVLPALTTALWVVRIDRRYTVVSGANAGSIIAAIMRVHVARNPPNSRPIVPGPPGMSLSPRMVKYQAAEAQPSSANKAAWLRTAGYARPGTSGGPGERS